MVGANLVRLILGQVFYIGHGYGGVFPLYSTKVMAVEAYVRPLVQVEGIRVHLGVFRFEVSCRVFREVL